MLASAGADSLDIDINSTDDSSQWDMSQAASGIVEVTLTDTQTSALLSGVSYSSMATFLVGGASMKGLEFVYQFRGDDGSFQDTLKKGVCRALDSLAI
jgi:hypothetical protein